MPLPRLTALVLACLLALAATVGPAAVPEDKGDLKARVAQLVDQLGVPAKQAAAETELLKLGPDVLPHLPGPEVKLTPVQRERLRSIRTTLQEAQVLRDAAPRMVTLQNKAITLSQAVEQIQKQTNLALEDK